ncbi:hypothetical protein [Cryptosporangium arvum]|nr:hypothetical protein [Cryptosporangium arvum]
MTTIMVILAIGAAGVGMIVLAAVLNRRARLAREGRSVDLEAVRAEVLAALDRGDPIGAVKVYRYETGLSLVEANDAVQRIAINRR